MFCSPNRRISPMTPLLKVLIKAGDWFTRFVINHSAEREITINNDILDMLPPFALIIHKLDNPIHYLDRPSFTIQKENPGQANQ
jgi:hypothetical protein